MLPETTQGAGTAQTSQGTGEPTIAPAGQPGQPQSGQDQIDRKVIESRAHAHGRSEGTKELLSRLGLTSVEELSAVVSSHREAAQATEARDMAEREEKIALAAKLAGAERKLADAARFERRYAELRGALKADRIKAAVLGAQCLPDAADDAARALAEHVKWSEGDEEQLEVFSLADPSKKLGSLAELVSELKATKDFFFAGAGRSGSGFVRGGPRGAPAQEYVAPPSMTELLGWKKPGP